MLLLAVVVATAVAGPANAAGTGTIIGSACAGLRVGPNTSAAQTACIPVGTRVSIDCTAANGNAVTGHYGTTTLWDHTSYAGHPGYVSDAYVYTGVNGAVAGQCSSLLTIKGGAACSYHPVVGIWVQRAGGTGANGGAEFAPWGRVSPGGYQASFRIDLTRSSLPVSVQVHTGCGGTSGSWWSDNWTGNQSVNGSSWLFARCNEGTTKPASGSNQRCAFIAQSRTCIYNGGHYLGAWYWDTHIAVPSCGPRPTYDTATNRLGTVYPYLNALPMQGYQCVDLPERYLYYRYGYTMPLSTNGDQVVDHYYSRYPTSFARYSNGAVGHAPKQGDILSFSTVHTGIVESSSVNSSGNGSIVMIDENGSKTGSTTLTVSGWKVQYSGATWVKWLHKL